MTIDELRKIAAAATSGPDGLVAQTRSEANARYIATFNPALVLKLLDEVAALRAREQAFVAFIDDLESIGNAWGIDAIDRADVLEGLARLKRGESLEGFARRDSTPRTETEPPAT